MRHHKHYSCRTLDRLADIWDRNNILRELDIWEVFLVDMGGINDFSELLALKL